MNKPFCDVCNLQITPDRALAKLINMPRESGFIYLGLSVQCLRRDSGKIGLEPLDICWQCFKDAVDHQDSKRSKKEIT